MKEKEKSKNEEIKSTYEEKFKDSENVTEKPTNELQEKYIKIKQLRKHRKSQE